ncbi:unnamed protein product, partial [Owenia fusiformis]
YPFRDVSNRNYNKHLVSVAPVSTYDVVILVMSLCDCSSFVQDERSLKDPVQVSTEVLFPNLQYFRFAFSMGLISRIESEPQTGSHVTNWNRRCCLEDHPSPGRGVTLIKMQNHLKTSHPLEMRHPLEY